MLMSSSREKLAQSLEFLAGLQAGSRRVFRSAELTRTHRERLIRNGFLRSAMKGWLFASDPAVPPGHSTAWYSCFWEFCACYCEHRFGESWHLSAEQSLLSHADASAIPRQVLVYSPHASHHLVELPFGTSIFHLVISRTPDRADVVLGARGLRLLSVETALIRVSERFFRAHPAEALTVLTRLDDHTQLLRRLLNGAHTTIAGRLAGAYRTAGRGDAADDLITAMKSAGYDIRERDPFADTIVAPPLRSAEQPGSVRLRLMWHDFRAAVAAVMPPAPGLPADGDSYLAVADNRYRQDAYHSLSIEGYRVSPQLVEQVRSGGWNPDSDRSDASARDALAARGYWQAFQQVRRTVAAVIEGADAAALAREGHRDWYRQLFAPSVEAGLISAGELSGYRRHAVFLSGSRHVPMRWEAVPEAMSVLFDLLSAEDDPAVRAVLGHFFFGFIHPYPDGNGRLARLLMNTMLASGGYPWTVVHITDRTQYMETLEAASVEQRVGPFAEFITAQVQRNLHDEPREQHHEPSEQSTNPASNTTNPASNL